MGEIFLKTLIIMAALLLFVVPGFVLKKLGLLGAGAKTTLGNILLYVCQPALMISSFAVFSDGDYAVIASYDKLTLLGGFGIAAAISAVSIAAMFGLCRAVFAGYRNRSEADVYTFIAMFSNCGFLGVPFVKMLTDGNVIAVMYLMVFNLVFAVMTWTLGVYLISHDRKNISPKKVLLNPTVLACAAALVLFFVPEINFFMFDKCKDLGIVPSALSTMNAPIAMILVGVALADLPVKSLFDRKGIYIAGGLRLIVAPIVTFGVAIVFKLLTESYVGGLNAETDYIFLAPVLAMCMSPASIIVAMAERYGGERDLASAAYVTDTLFSIVTVPLLVMSALELWKMFG